MESATALNWKREVQRAHELARRHSFLEAVAVGQAANRLIPDPALECDLRNWRHAACHTNRRPDPSAAWPPKFRDPFPTQAYTLPEITGDELSLDVMGGAIQHHGALLVRRLIPRDRMATLVGAIEAAFASRASGDGRQSDYSPLKPLNGTDLNADRLFPGFHLLMADAPHFLAKWMDELEARGVLKAVAGYLGERPAIAAYKAALYNTPADTGTQWHQDGAFYHAQVRTVNLWVAGSQCGIDAPGLDVVPWRIGSLVETGTHGSKYDWSVGEPVVERLASGRAIAAPTFEPGDAILFDHLCLHRTGVRPGMSSSRYAIETWLFASSCYQDDARKDGGALLIA